MALRQTASKLTSLKTAKPYLGVFSGQESNAAQLGALTAVSHATCQQCVPSYHLICRLDWGSPFGCLWVLVPHWPPWVFGQLHKAAHNLAAGFPGGRERRGEGEGKRRCPRWQGLSNASHPPAHCCYQVCSLAAEIRQEVGSLGAMRVYFSGLHGKDGVYPEQGRGKVINLLRRV